LQGVVNGRVNEAGLSTAAPDRRAQCSAVEWTRAEVAVRNVVTPTLSPSQRAASRVERLMSTFSEVTGGVGGT